MQWTVHWYVQGIDAPRRQRPAMPQHWAIVDQAMIFEARGDVLGEVVEEC